MRGEFGWLSFLTPRTAPERRAFNAVSVTAGICEEVIYRGYVMAYLVALSEWLTRPHGSYQISN